MNKSAGEYQMTIYHNLNLEQAQIFFTPRNSDSVTGIPYVLSRTSNSITCQVSTSYTMAMSYSYFIIGSHRVV